MSSQIKIHQYRPKGKVHHNLTVSQFRDKILKRNEGVLSKTGALVVNTAPFTGRSPNDRYIVDSSAIHKDVLWNEVNAPISEANFESLHKKIGNHLSLSEHLFIYDGLVGADPEYSFHVRVITEKATQALFSSHLLRKPKLELKNRNPDITILCAPDCKADPKRDGTRSPAFVILHLPQKLILIGTTSYAGEIKKSIFTMLNFILPKKGVFPMHCSANVGKYGDCALFFGLSGTGKTTLSADPKRKLVGDDEHGWGPNGIFNFEGGCYAKCINLREEHEPMIFKAIRDDALVENVPLDKGRELDFDDASITENTRAAFPLHHIDNYVLSGMADHPKNIIFLTADAFGVLPPIACLDEYGAMYHFMSGYTSKLAGTERGIKDPQATFSVCFGAPFMPRYPIVYAKLLASYMKRYKSKVYLVNTGWSGGSYGIGKRISIHDTRKIITAILDGKLEKVPKRRDLRFNLDVPESVLGVDRAILNPRKLWANKRDYDKKAKKLAMLFRENIEKLGKIEEKVIKAGPRIT